MPNILIAGKDLPIVGDSVDDLIVNADARACGESGVIQERRMGSVAFDEFSDYAVHMLCRDARLDNFLCRQKGTGGYRTGFSHFFDFNRRFAFNHALRLDPQRIPSAERVSAVVSARSS